MSNEANQLRYQLEMRELRVKEIRRLEEENAKLKSENLRLKLSLKGAKR